MSISFEYLQNCWYGTGTEFLDFFLIFSLLKPYHCMSLCVQDKLKLVTVLGAGLLVGTALAVIIPEGVHTLYDTQTGELIWIQFRPSFSILMQCTPHPPPPPPPPKKKKF